MNRLCAGEHAGDPEDAERGGGDERRSGFCQPADGQTHLHGAAQVRPHGGAGLIDDLISVNRNK